MWKRRVKKKKNASLNLSIEEIKIMVSDIIIKLMTNIDSILKCRDITLPTKVHLVKAMVFLVVMYGCDSLTLRKAEHWRIDAFERGGVGEDSWESLGVQGDPTSPS